MIKYKLYPLLIAATFLLYACGAQATSTPTETPALTANRTATPKPTKEPKVGTDIKVELPVGDLTRGESEAKINACINCHVNSDLAIRFESDGDLPNIMERGEIRMADPAYKGNASTNEEYILESILLPEIYIVDSNWNEGEGMTPDFGKLLTRQDLADILVWMSTYN